MSICRLSIMCGMSMVHLGTTRSMTSRQSQMFLHDDLPRMSTTSHAMATTAHMAHIYTNRKTSAFGALATLELSIWRFGT
jgi:hypothetical protein